MKIKVDTIMPLYFDAYVASCPSKTTINRFVGTKTGFFRSLGQDMGEKQMTAEYIDPVVVDRARCSAIKNWCKEPTYYRRSRIELWSYMQGVLSGKLSPDKLHKMANEKRTAAQEYTVKEQSPRDSLFDRINGLLLEGYTSEDIARAAKTVERISDVMSKIAA